MSNVHHIIAIDQSASINTKKNRDGGFYNAIGWSIWHDKELVEYGEFHPDYPDFKETRGWLRAKILSLTEVFDGSADYNDVCIAIETVWLGKNARLFQRLVSVKEHVHAVASDDGCVYLEISPAASAYALTGISRYPKGERKIAVMKSAEMLVGKPISEHESDSIAIGMAAYNHLFGT